VISLDIGEEEPWIYTQTGKAIVSTVIEKEEVPAEILPQELEGIIITKINPVISETNKKVLKVFVKLNKQAPYSQKAGYKIEIFSSKGLAHQKKGIIDLAFPGKNQAVFFEKFYFPQGTIDITMIKTTISIKGNIIEKTYEMP
ncbi:hypothetical protein ACFL56_03300, partial [Candidatus Margulisiibacteriota bacterium]